LAFLFSPFGPRRPGDSPDRQAPPPGLDFFRCRSEAIFATSWFLFRRRFFRPLAHEGFFFFLFFGSFWGDRGSNIRPLFSAVLEGFPFFFGPVFFFDTSSFFPPTCFPRARPFAAGRCLPVSFRYGEGRRNPVFPFCSQTPLVFFLDGKRRARGVDFFFLPPPWIFPRTNSHRTEKAGVCFFQQREKDGTENFFSLP